MRRLLPLAALLLLALPAHAGPAAPAFLTIVAAGDADQALELRTAQATVGYIDANGNRHPDAAQPDEPVYLDLDASGSVTYGDLRLAPFDAYAAGTAVDLTNRDVGRPLTPVPGPAFAQAGTTWVLDMDGSMTLSVGDVQFTPLPGKVHAGGAGLGTPLAKPSGTQSGTYGWTGGGARDPERPLYLDLDPFSNGGGHVSAGDLRIVPLGLASEDAATRAQLELAVQRAQAAAAAPQAKAPDPTPIAPASLSSVPAAWRALDWFVVGLGVLNLVGLVAVARRLGPGPPRNPFK